MENFEDFVLQGSQKITPAQIARFQDGIPTLKARIAGTQTPQQPHLHEQASFLLRFVEDCLDGAYQPNDISSIAQSLFALMYLDRGVDIIPDMVPGVGYSDDSAVLRTVLLGHPAEFQLYSTKIGADYGSISLEK